MIHLVSAAKANARLNGRHVVDVEDVFEMAPFVLRHRLIVDASETTTDVVLEEAIAYVRNSRPSPVRLPE